jgi:hypothetical protein
LAYTIVAGFDGVRRLASGGFPGLSPPLANLSCAECAVMAQPPLRDGLFAVSDIRCRSNVALEERPNFATRGLPQRTHSIDMEACSRRSRFGAEIGCRDAVFNGGTERCSPALPA